VRAFCLVLALGLASPPAPPPAGYIYKASLVQAAPGRLLELIELHEGLRAAMADGGDEAPFIGSHHDTLAVAIK
jgi:hypothetical protein